MKNIVIIGSSIVGVKSAELIREKDKESKITILAYDDYYPANVDLFFEMVKGNVEGTALDYRSKDFFEANQIEVVFDCKINRINFQRKKIFAEGRNPTEYDIVILTEPPKHIYPSIKGANKEGVFGFAKYSDAKAVAENIPLIDSVIIQSDTLQGIQLAAAIIAKGKETIIVCSEKNLFSQVLTPELASHALALLEEKGIRFIEDNEISEILGDSMVKAVRLSSEKVLACQNAIFPEADVDLRIFNEFKKDDRKKIEVGSNLQTSLEGVFAGDILADIEGKGMRAVVRDSNSLEIQAQAIVQAIEGTTNLLGSPFLNCSFELGGIEISLLGDLSFENFSLSQSEFDQEQKSVRAIYIKDNSVQGALLINRQDEKEALINTISRKFQNQTSESRVAETSDSPN